MVMVPLVLPTTPPLTKNPLFMYFSDPFKKPCAFVPDVVVDIASVVDYRARALNFHESQMWEWMPWIDRKEEEVGDLKGEKERLCYLVEQYSEKLHCCSAKLEKMEELYGRKFTGETKYCESFEFCEYGMRVGVENLGDFFPMIEKK